MPPTVSTVPFKVFLCGRSGVGKTAVVSYLSGRHSSSLSFSETPGIRVTDVYWPAKLVDSRIILFKLSLWDAGDAAGKKYSHVNPVRFINPTLVCSSFLILTRSRFVAKTLLEEYSSSLSLIELAWRRWTRS